MVYLIYSNQVPAIKNRAKRIVKELLGEADDMNYVRYDGSNVLIQECIDDANNLPLGYDKKVVAVDNCYFLSKEKTRNKIETDQDYSTLINFINNPSEECHLILMVSTLDINTKSDVYKAVEAKGKLIPIEDPDERTWKEGVRKYCIDNLHMNIDLDAINELADRTTNDVALLQNSAQKLSLFKDHITYDDVVLMVTRPLEDNSFLLFNLLLNEDNMGALNLFRDLKEANTEPVVLISMLGGQFRLLDEILYLSKKGLDNDAIAAELGIKPVRVSIMRKNAGKVSSRSLHRALDELFNLDLQIKSGSVDRFYAFELFLINFRRM